MRVDGELVTSGSGAGRCEQTSEALQLRVDVFDQDRKQRLQRAGAVGHALTHAPLALLPRPHLVDRNRTRRRPHGPLRRLVGPGLDVAVEGADGDEHGVGAGARSAVLAQRQALTPTPIGVLIEPKVALIRVDPFDRSPEGAAERRS